MAVVAFLFLILLELTSRSRAPDGLRFQVWSSERLMQTLSVNNLREEPLRSLWYLHIQPPLFDAFRALLVQVHPSLQGGTLSALALPVVFVAAVSIVFEKGENVRFRFFIEPVLFVFLCAEAARAVRRPRSRPIV